MKLTPALQNSENNLSFVFFLDSCTVHVLQNNQYKVIFIFQCFGNIKMKYELYISKHIKEIGYQLIRDLNLHNGSDLSGYLSVNHCYKNHDALLIWLQKEYGENEIPLDLNETKEKLFQHLPDSIINY